MRKKDLGSSGAMWRGGAIPALFIAVLSMLISSLSIGISGFYGSLISTFTVVIFFSVSLLVSNFTKNANPMMTLALALFSYFTKLLLMAGFLLAVTSLTTPDAVNRSAFGISAIAIAIAWLAGEFRAFLGLRLTLPLPPSSAEKPEQE